MRQLFGYRFRRTTIWLWLFIGMLAGLGFAHSWASPCLLAGLCMLPFFCFSFARWNILTLVLITLFGLLLGWWRGAIYMQKLARFKDLDHQAVTLTAVANADAVYSKTK